MSIPYADRVSLPWLFAASLHLDNPAMPDSFRKGSHLVARFADYPGALEALVHAIAVQVKRAAPDMQTEIDTIDEFEGDPRRKPTSAWRQDRDHAPRPWDSAAPPRWVAWQR